MYRGIRIRIRRFIPLSRFNYSTNSHDVASGDATRLQFLLTKFTDKVKVQQQGSYPLLAAIDRLIDKYQSTLVDQLNISTDQNQEYIQLKQQIWDRLSICDHDLYNHYQKVYKIRRDEINKHKLQIDQVGLHNRFVDQLYPLKNQENVPFTTNTRIQKQLNIPVNLMKYQLINHKQLFHSLHDLPSPQPFYLKDNELNDFIERFLFNKRNFKKVNTISEINLDIFLSYNNDSTNHYIGFAEKKWVEMFKERLEYVRMITKLLNDLKNWGIPININEENKLISYIFYKDPSSLIDKYQQLTSHNSNSNSNLITNLNSNTRTIENDTLEYQDFNLNIYHSLKQSILNNSEFRFDDKNIDLHINTYNTFLFLAIRHDKLDIVEEIIKDLQLTFILNDPTSQYPKSIDNKTLVLLLNYFGDVKYQSYFENILDYIINQDRSIIMDIKLINTIMKSLIMLNRLDLSEQLLSQLFLNNVNKQPKEIDSELEQDEDTYQYQLTNEDKTTYKKLLLIFKNLKRLTNDQEIQFNIKPIEKTFSNLIEQYCSDKEVNNSFNKVRYLLSIMETYYQLPTSTKLFKIIFKKFKSTTVGTTNNEEWKDLQELINFIIKLINLHDYGFNITQDTSIFSSDLKYSKLNKIALSPQLKHFINNHLEIPNNTLSNLSYSNGNFIKLPNILIDLIYNAIIVNLSHNAAQNSGLIEKIHSQKLQLDQKLNSINWSHYSNESKQLHKIDEIAYVKKGFLIDLVDILDN
ncbi:hypothetical protein DFJ63DRAFT_138318 [Scheffersomyces coipomensis]|uniref:uncharacterized protein n=1 Tax=Scheffersomyces coipomensis TaxID=1788519 RepID=UPI00315CF064